MVFQKEHFIHKIRLYPIDTTGIYVLHSILAITGDVSSWLQNILELFICIMLQ